MTPSGVIAVLVLLVTNLGTVLTAWVSMATLKRGVAKENANRRIALEEYVVAIDHYHRDIRAYLLKLADDKVIDIARVELSRFRPPSMPRYNGK